MKTIILILVIALVTLGGCEKLFTTEVTYEVECSPPGFAVTYTDKEFNDVDSTVNSNYWKHTELFSSVDEGYIGMIASSDSSIFSSNIEISAYLYVDKELIDEDMDGLFGTVVVGAFIGY